MATNKILVLSDVHLEHGEPIDPAYQVVKRFIAANTFETIILLGDFLDFSYCSRWTKETPRLRENKRLKGDVDLATAELDFLQKRCKSLIYASGNHEQRINTVLNENPMFEGLIDLPIILGLEERGIDFIPEDKQPFKILDGLYALHGKRMGKNYASQVLADYPGATLLQGHCHRPQAVYISNNLTGQVHAGVGLGTLGPIHPKYANGFPTGHTHGFAVIEYIDSAHWQVNNIVIDRGSFFYNGKFYQ